MTKDTENHSRPDDADIAALRHATLHLHHSSGVRLKNFNFYLIIVGTLVVAAYNTVSVSAQILIATGGLFFSVIFLILDIRELRRIMDARADLKIIEPKFGLTLHKVDEIADPERNIQGSQRRRLLTTTVAYRSVQGGIALLCLLRFIYLIVREFLGWVFAHGILL